MRHIKRKYLFRVAPSALENLEKAGQVKKAHETASAELHEFINDDKEKFAILTTDSNELVIGFVHKIKGNLFAIPDPDPVLVYFNNAQRTFRLIDKSRTELFGSLHPFEGSSIFAGDVGDKLYDFMFASTSCTIFLFTAIEAMINKMLPTDYIHKEERRDGTVKSFDFDLIQKQLDFKTKLQILNSIYGRSFETLHPREYQTILGLKNLRDSIVHSKRKSDKLGTFSHIFKESLSFDYEKTILAVRDFINFYQPDWVEECDCGGDF